MPLLAGAALGSGIWDRNRRARLAAGVLPEHDGVALLRLAVEDGGG